MQNPSTLCSLKKNGDNFISYNWVLNIVELIEKNIMSRINKIIPDPEFKKYLHHTAFIQDKYMHKKHQAESIVKNLDIHSKEKSKGNF